MNTLEKARADGKINREIVSSLYRNGPIIPTNSNIKVFKNGREVAKQVFVEAHQAVEFASPVSHIVYTASNYSPNIFSSANGKIDVKIDRGSSEKVTAIKFRIRLTETSGTNYVRVVPSPYFFDRIEFWAEGGSGDQISVRYADPMYWLYNVYSDEQNSNLLAEAGSSIKWENNTAIPPSSHVDYYLELPGSFIEIVKPYIEGFKGDLICRLYTRNGIIASGTGTVELSQLDIILEQDDIGDTDQNAHNEMFRNNILRTTFLDMIQVSETKTCTAGAETKFTLENLVGKCAFMMFCLRSSTSVVNNAITNYTDITDMCQIDLLGPQNQKLLAKGTPIYGQVLKTWMNKHFPGSLTRYKNVYIIPFTHSAMKSFTHIDGYMYFHGENYNLSLTFPTSGVNEIQTITLTNPGNDGGHYQLSYKGYVTDCLSYSSNTAAIKSALEALPSMVQDGLTVTASGAATSTFTLTFSPPKPVAYSNGHNNNLVKIIPCSLNDGGVFESGVTTVTTPGVNGWVTGSYQLDLYAFCYRDFFFDDGRIRVLS